MLLYCFEVAVHSPSTVTGRRTNLGSGDGWHLSNKPNASCILLVFQYWIQIIGNWYKIGMITAESKIGNKGEIYLPVNVRRELKLNPGSKIKFIVLPNGKLYIMQIPSIDNFIDKKPLLVVSPDELERVSEEMQSKRVEGY